MHCPAITMSACRKYFNVFTVLICMGAGVPADGGAAKGFPGRVRNTPGGTAQLRRSRPILVEHAIANGHLHPDSFTAQIVASIQSAYYEHPDGPPQNVDDAERRVSASVAMLGARTNNTGLTIGRLLDEAPSGMTLAPHTRLFDNSSYYVAPDGARITPGQMEQMAREMSAGTMSIEEFETMYNKLQLVNRYSLIHADGSYELVGYNHSTQQVTPWVHLTSKPLTPYQKTAIKFRNAISRHASHSVRRAVAQKKIRPRGLDFTILSEVERLYHNPKRPRPQSGAEAERILYGAIANIKQTAVGRKFVDDGETRARLIQLVPGKGVEVVPETIRTNTYKVFHHNTQIIIHNGQRRTAHKLTRILNDGTLEMGRLILATDTEPEAWDVYVHL